MNLLDAGIPKRTVNALNKKNIFTTYDLLNWVPRKYKDFTTLKSIDEACALNEECAVRLHFSDGKIEGSYGKDLRYTVRLIDEETGELVKATWFGNTYVSKFYKCYEGQNVIVGGKFNHHEQYGYQISAPELFELEDNFKARMIPVLKKVKGVSESNLKSLIYEQIKKVEEPLEADILKRLDCIGLKDAYFNVFYPKCKDDIVKGKRRLLMNDLLFFAMQLKLNQTENEKGFIFNSNSATINFVSNLPFDLTEDQKNTLNLVVMNAKKGIRNDILVQGDVGCGKTVVAFTAMVNAVENGYQAALVAPTQVLASQHYEELKMRLNDNSVAFVHAGLKAAEKRKIVRGLKSGAIKYAVGTHSLFNKDIEFNNLGVIITDEEHRFGVKQKEILKEKAMSGVHVISMSATPIPRTIASVYFGESKQICNIRSMPKGRKPIITRRQLHHENAFNCIKQEVEAGHQVYVVCPAIGKDEDMDDYTEDEEMKSVLKAKANYDAHFKGSGFNIAVLHGKMKKDDIADTINAFSRNEVQILISTTVIEVGVNVPNATVMVIEEAERFGLATLHQLRGRVGRGNLQSWCILISDDAKTNERLIAMEQHSSGFEIAEIDMQLRGTGNLIGTKQSGFDKYIISILENQDFYEKIKAEAEKCIEEHKAEKLSEFYKEAA